MNRWNSFLNFSKLLIKKELNLETVTDNNNGENIINFLLEKGNNYKKSKEITINDIKAITDKLGYDYIIIDTPPTFSNLTIASLVASTDVVIPLEADSFSLQGFEALYKLINGVRERYNNSLNIAGLLLIKYKARQTLSKLIKESLEKRAAECGTTLFTSTIRDSVLIKKALLLKQNIFKDYPNQPITKDYESFCLDLLGVYER